MKEIDNMGKVIKFLGSCFIALLLAGLGIFQILLFVYLALMAFTGILSILAVLVLGFVFGEGSWWFLAAIPAFLYFLVFLEVQEELGEILLPSSVKKFPGHCFTEFSGDKYRYRKGVKL